MGALKQPHLHAGRSGAQLSPYLSACPRLASRDHIDGINIFASNAGGLLKFRTGRGNTRFSS